MDCDYLFLAADTMRARLLFNAIVHQYLVPGVQVGAKVHEDDGRTFVWIGRRRETGRGVGTGNLRFDQIQPTQQSP